LYLPVDRVQDGIYCGRHVTLRMDTRELAPPATSAM
jgi:hypothetical protein